MKTQFVLLSVIITCVFANFLLWLSVRDVQAKWLNVPPVPSQENAAGSGLGDAQFAYRNISIMLQNLGDSGGRTTPLNAYDYDELGRWFMLADHLDPKSNFIPFLAAYYFGGVEGAPEKLPPVIKFLEHVGGRGINEKWRWLAQAVHLARYKYNDMDWALLLAQKLSSLSVTNMPIWAKNMNVLVMNARGEKESAYQMLMQILQTEGDNLHPTEVIFMVDQICNAILDEREAKVHPLCQEFPY